MIPRIIHYCWFGRGKKPKLAKKCIDSWKRFCPDYKIIEWNEDNFDVDKYEYAKYCSENKQWAYLSDFVRLVVVYEYGGIYFDTDVELIKSPVNLLKYKAFYGFENNNYVATGLGFGAQKNDVTVKAMFNCYLKMTKTNSRYELLGCPLINTRTLEEFGLKKNGKRQSLNGVEIFPQDYFNPLDDSTGRCNLTDNTISINHYGKSWMKKRIRVKSRVAQIIRRYLNIKLRK